MALTLGRSTSDDPAPEAARRSGLAAPPGTTMRAALLTVVLATTYVTARHGSPLWQLTRIVAVLSVGALVSRGLESASRRRRGVLACATALVAVAVGVGIGVPHARKAGVAPMTVAGLLALAAGIVLLVLGATLLLRAGRRWQRIALLPGLVLALGLALLMVAQPIAATNVPPTELGERTPADLGLTYVDVRFPAAGGVTLAGWYVPSENGAAVVLRHGSGSTRTATLEQAAVLADLGYGVLLVDARGHGESDGRAMDFGWYGDADIAASIDHLLQQPGVDPNRIGVVGLSMGGEEAIGAAATDERIRAVVAEGATGRTAADKRWLSEEHGALGWVQEQLDRVTYGLVDVLTAASPPTALRAAVEAAPTTPMLLIAATGEPDEEPAGRYIQAGSPGSVDLWVVEGADHTGGLDRAPAEWTARVGAFLEQALAAS